MTKKLSWRLKELPNAEEVASLVETGVISKEEARELLFNDEKSHDVVVENKALKEQIEFLQKTVDKLINQRTWGHITYTTTTPTKYWHNIGYGNLMNVSGANSVQLTGAISGTTLTANNSVKLGDGNKIK